MDKQRLQQQVIQLLENDLAAAIRAAQTAHEAATHEENVAENKYDTLGLEASYLAAGQARRVEEIRQALQAWRTVQLRAFDEQVGIQLGALVELSSDNGKRQCLLLGPDGAGLKVQGDNGEIILITPRAPLGQQLLGQGIGDEVSSGPLHWTIDQVY